MIMKQIHDFSVTFFNKKACKTMSFAGFYIFAVVCVPTGDYQITPSVKISQDLQLLP